MNYTTYILFSSVLDKYYIGYTENIHRRLTAHNAGYSSYTSKGVPWVLIWSQEQNSKKEAIQLENRIKKRGAKRFLEDAYRVALQAPRL